jgi:hypothetical protein
MVKYIYPVWKEAARTGDDFRDQLIQELAPGLLAIGALERLRIAVADSVVSSASGKRMENLQTNPDGMISVYLQGDEDKIEGDKVRIDAAIEASVDRASCYQVREAEPIKNIAHPAPSGERVYGLCQVVFLQRPARLTHAQWLEIWQGSHTQVAIDTQSTFAYRQNVIIQSCSEGAPELHAMIEESFPPEAMTSDQAFYGVTNDEDLQSNMKAMLESCARFIDFDKIDVIPMSEYVFRP